MPSYIVPPITKRLTLPCGEWIDVKARLNHGEYQDMMERCYRLGDDGLLQRVPFKYNEAQMTAYLVDWSLTGPDDQVIPIRGAAPDVVLSTIRMLEQWIVREMHTAIDAHVTDAREAAAVKKTTPTGDAVSSTT
jgi:hypothetical protein